MHRLPMTYSLPTLIIVFFILFYKNDTFQYTIGIFMFKFRFRFRPQLRPRPKVRFRFRLINLFRSDTTFTFNDILNVCVRAGSSISPVERPPDCECEQEYRVRAHAEVIRNCNQIKHINEERSYMILSEIG